MANPLAPTPQTQATQSGSANPLAPPANPFLDPHAFRQQHGMSEAPDPTGAAATKAAQRLVTGTSQALDFQRERTARSYTGKTGYEAQSEALRHGEAVGLLAPLLNTYGRAFGALHDFHAPDTGIAPLDTFQHHANDLGNNLLDAAMWLPLDPLTWETFGVGAAAKTPAGMALRAAARAGVAKTLNRTMAGKLIYKHLGPWGAEVVMSRGAAAGDIGKGLADVETAQGAGHAATAEGQRWEQHVTRRVNEIINGVNPATRKKIPEKALTDAEKMRVAQRLNGEEHLGTEGQYEPTQPVKAFRYHKPGEIPEEGSFYSVGEPGVDSDHYLHPDWGQFIFSRSPGGTVLHTAEFYPQKPLTLTGPPGPRGGIGVQALRKFYDPQAVDALGRWVANPFTDHPPAQAEPILRDLGVVPKEGHLFGQNNETTEIENLLNSGKTPNSILDALGSRAAKARGYDAIIGDEGDGRKQFVDLGASREDASRLRPMTPREQVAYRQLRSLTAMDWKARQRAALSVALRTQIADPALRDEVASYFKSGKEPIVPEAEARVKVAGPSKRPFNTPYLEAQNLLDKATQELGLNPHDRRFLGQSLTNDNVFENLTDPEMRQRAEQMRAAYHATYPDEPTYKMPAKNAAEMTHMEKVREAYLKILGEVSKKQEGGLMGFREDYLPFAHEDFGDPMGREGFIANPALHNDPRIQERANMKVTSPKQLERGFTKGLAPNLNRQIQTRVLNEKIPELLNDPEIEKLFASEVRPTGARRSPEQWLSDITRAVVGFPRAALVSLSPGHAVNELNMAAQVVPIEDQPKFFSDAMTLARKIFKAQASGDMKEYAALTAPGRKLGAGVGSFAERKAFFQQVPILKKYTALNNRLVWSVSEAIRQKYAEYLVEHGEAEGLRAGGLAEKRLVDYQYRTPLQNLFRHIAPFGTYRGGIPGAVGGAALRRPFQAATLNRASGGIMYGDKPEPGQPGWESFVPSAEVGRLLNFGSEKSTSGRTYPVSGPGDYLRNSLGIPIAAGLNAAQDVLAPGLKPSHWATYGQPWLPKRLKDGRLDLGFLLMSALSGVPQAQTILEANGMSRFQWRGLLNEAMRQGARVQYTPPQPVATPIPFLSAPPSAATPSTNPLAPPQ